MSDFFTFDSNIFVSLDEFALIAYQEFNLGNESDWFSTFRSGLFGLEARMYGLAEHLQTVHASLTKRMSPKSLEYHLSSIFFNMNSAVECLTFALNAVGYAAEPTSFRNVANSMELRLVSPRDIIGIREINPPLPLRDGYSRIFPTLQEYWMANRELLFTIFDLHYVSKHCSTILNNGRAIHDPLHGFYEKKEAGDIPHLKVIFLSMEKIKHHQNPEDQVIDGTLQTESDRDRIYLESIARKFSEFINVSGMKALNDVKMNIKIPHKKFASRFE
jgi:hypothetical protein